MEHEDSFVESVEGLIETIKKLTVKPVKRITGFATYFGTCIFIHWGN